MAIEKSITLTTFELASCLTLCGYESMANQVINDIGMNKDLNMINRLVEQTEGSLRVKGFFDDNSPTMLVSGLENLLHLLVQSKKKIRCIRGEHVLFIHLLNQHKVLVQDIRNQNHTFSIQMLKESTLKRLIKDHLELKNTDIPFKEELNALMFTESLFDEIHYLDTTILEQMYTDKSLDREFRIFLDDFNNSKQEFNNISFMEMDYIKDFLELKQVHFMLINEQFIWHLDYENIQDDKIYIIPLGIEDYFTKLTQNIKDFFALVNV